LVELMMQAII